MTRQRSCACLAAWLFVLVPALACAEVTTTDLKLKSGDTDFRAVLAMPDGPGPFPAVVVIQEWYGLTDWIVDNAKRLASKGYIALAPDLYHGKVTDDPTVAGQLLKGLPRDRALRDLKTCVDELSRNPKVKKDKIGVIGWCMGGGFALDAALNDPRLTACVICYGRVVTTEAGVKPIKAAVLGVFGERDFGIPVDDVRQFEKALKDAGKTVKGIHIYPAGHGFMRDKNNAGKPNPAFNKDAVRQAWEQIDDFFHQVLGS